MEAGFVMLWLEPFDLWLLVFPVPGFPSVWSSLDSDISDVQICFLFKQS